MGAAAEGSESMVHGWGCTPVLVATPSTGACVGGAVVAAGRVVVAVGVIPGVAAGEVDVVGAGVISSGGLVGGWEPASPL